MKKFSSAFSLLFLFFFSLISCKKINEPTSLGGDLIPPVDNVNTFEKHLDAITDNRYFDDTATASFNDDVALGYINDPEFGRTRADVYFNLVRLNYNRPVFDSLVRIDSVVLSLSYKGSYGDTTAGQPPLHVRVHEITPSANPVNSFSDTTFYQFDHPDFSVAGELGAKTFFPRRLSDSVQVVNRKGDTTKVANVLRIRLNDFGFITRLGGLADTSIKNDSALKANFRGFAIKADATGNTLAYFNPSEAKTKLTIYYTGTVGGKDSSLLTDFYHTYAVPPAIFPITTNPANFRNGLANLIRRDPGSTPYAANISTPNVADEVIYLQSAPNGSFTTIKLPQLDTFSNSVIHLAELVVTRLPSQQQNIFTPPSRLFLDRITESPDSAFVFLNDFFMPPQDVDFNRLGGLLRSDNTFRFNLTRTVQGIVTRKEKNYTLRLHVPFRTVLRVPGSPAPLTVQVLNVPAAGRVVLAGGNYPQNPNIRLRLRVIYSKI